MENERKSDIESWNAKAQQRSFTLLSYTQLDVPSQRGKSLDLTGGLELQSLPPFTGWEAWDQFL